MKPSQSKPQSTGTEGSGTLYVVGTPIGNLDDLSARAQATFRAVDLVIAEDTRRTRVLLAHIGATGKDLIHVDMFASEEVLAKVAGRIASGISAAVVSDAGTPVVADPGSSLVAACRARGVRIVVIPGPSAVTAALSVCGFAIGTFRSLGFLPRGAADRETLLSEVAGTAEAVVFFEAPHRMPDTLQALAARMPSRLAFVGRELTKLHEEQVVGELAHLARDHADRKWLGELTIVLAPWVAQTQAVDMGRICERIREELARGKPARFVAGLLSLETGLPKRDLYEVVNQVKAEPK